MVSIIQKPRTNRFLRFWKLFMKRQNYSRTTEIITSLIWEQRHAPSLETTCCPPEDKDLADEYQRLPPPCLHLLHTKLFAEIKHLHSTKSKFIPVFRIMSHAVEKAIILFHWDKVTELFRQIRLYNNMNLKSEPSFKECSILAAVIKRDWCNKI